MTKDVAVATGRTHIFRLKANKVELHIVWPNHLMDRLPDDFKLTLSGPGMGKQERTKPQGIPEDDTVRFEFEWPDKTSRVLLSAAGKGKTVDLWKQHVAGNLDIPLEWEDRLHPLLSEHAEAQATAPAVNAGSMPDDLNSQFLSSLWTTPSQ